jgi:peroxiredoxin
MQREGDAALDFRLKDVHGRPVGLPELLKGRKSVLLVFLRHLGCLPCREHAEKLCRRQDEIAALDAAVVIVSFATPAFASRWLAAYGMTRSFARSWSLKMVKLYIELLRSGRTWRGIHGDSTQLGGDFIVDARGILRLVHPSRDPSDRPEVERVIEILRQARERP